MKFDLILRQLYGEILKLQEQKYTHTHTPQHVYTHFGFYPKFFNFPLTLVLRGNIFKVI